MKPTRAVLEAVARLAAEGRVSGTAVNPDALGGGPTLDVVPGETEAAFQTRVIALARARGWRVAHFRKVRVQRKDGRTYWETPVAADGKGFTDLLLVRERLVVMELKVKKRRRKPDQLAWAEAFQRAGTEYYCFYPEDHQEIVRVLS
jgi:hypothetical protein